LGNLTLHQGDIDAARALFEESLALRRELGDTRGIATVLNNLGVVAMEQGDTDAARALYEESLTLRRELGDREGTATSLANLAKIALERGDDVAARALYAQSLSLHRDLSNWDGVVMCLEGLIYVAIAQNLPERATRLGGSLAVLLEARETLQLIDAGRLQQTINTVRVQLGEEAWRTAWAAGRALTVEQAIDYALNEGH
jgi:tetratricopeptide (TPR) repeat protein